MNSLYRRRHCDCCESEFRKYQGNPLFLEEPVVDGEMVLIPAGVRWFCNSCRPMFLPKPAQSHQENGAKDA